MAFITNKKWMENPKLNILNFKTGKIKIQETPDTDFSILGWKEKGIYILTYEGVKNKIYRYDGKKSEKIFDENKSLIDAAVSQKEDIIFYGAGNSEPPEIYFNGKAVTNSGKIFSKRSHSVKKTIIWSASDGTEVEGVLSVPEDFDENKKYPLLLCVHGGPTWISRDYLNTAARIYPIESFTEKGFIVLEPNYRGSIGYGEKFKSLNFKNLGIGDYDDVISGADYLISLGYADSEKIGIMGWSQGGYISAFCSTYSKRFKAISVGAGISDWTDYYYMTDIHTFTNQYLGENPWNDPEIYKKTSPMSYIKNACTPTMIQHGKSDTRVPVNNAYKLYQGLKDMKVPVELVLFEDMSHSPDKPGIQRAIMNQNLIWFSHYILGESDENLMK
ncbi:MAG: S9 family peptidase [Thermotogae bacterium]|nr:S9 family peptidase [Thermotogota bacterium]